MMRFPPWDRADVCPIASARRCFTIPTFPIAGFSHNQPFPFVKAEALPYVQLIESAQSMEPSWSAKLALDLQPIQRQDDDV
jgi:hypothetical protein